ncbi:hypothetical protein ACVDFE_05150 [Lentzea chajnantorensis]
MNTRPIPPLPQGSSARLARWAFNSLTVPAFRQQSLTRFGLGVALLDLVVDLGELLGDLQRRRLEVLVFDPRSARLTSAQTPEGQHVPESLQVVVTHPVTDALGLRSDGREPPGIVFERTGSLTHVIEGLLSLPALDARFAPRLVRASALELWVP